MRISDWSSDVCSSDLDCQACHVEPFVAVTDKACVGCHTGEHKAMSQAHAGASTAMLLAARAPPGAGGKLLAGFAKAFNKPEGRCVGCHTEHEGAGPMPATRSEERRVGTECVSPGGSGGWPCH